MQSIATLDSIIIAFLLLAPSSPIAKNAFRLQSPLGEGERGNLPSSVEGVEWGGDPGGRQFNQYSSLSSPRPSVAFRVFTVMFSLGSSL